MHRSYKPNLEPILSELGVYSHSKFSELAELKLISMKEDPASTICQSDWGSGGIVSDLRKVLLENPKTYARKYGLAIVNILENDLNGAIEDLNAIIDDNPKMALIHRRIAEILIYQSQHEKAIKYLEKAVELDETDLTSLTWLSLIYHRLGKTEKALSKQEALESMVFSISVLRY